MPKSESQRSAPNVPKIAFIGILLTATATAVLNRPASLQDFKDMIAYREPSTEIDDLPNEVDVAPPNEMNVADATHSPLTESAEHSVSESVQVEADAPIAVLSKSVAGEPRNKTGKSASEDWPSTPLLNKPAETETAAHETSDNKPKAETEDRAKDKAEGEDLDADETSKIESTTESISPIAQPAQQDTEKTQVESAAQKQGDTESNSVVEKQNAGKQNDKKPTVTPKTKAEPITAPADDLPPKAIADVPTTRPPESIPAPSTANLRKPQLPKPQNAPPTIPTDTHLVRKPFDDAHTLSLYTESCAGCHGSNGSGREMIGDFPTMPDFTAAAWQEKRSAARIRAAINFGAGTDMPPFEDKVSDEEMDKLVQLIRSFGPKSDSSSPPKREDVADNSRGDKTSADDTALEDFRSKRAELLNAWNQLTDSSSADTE